MIKAKFTGLDKMIKKLDESVDEAKRISGEKVAAVTLDTHALTVKQIQKASSGKKEKRYHKGRRPKEHTVSKPGDAPNTDTGFLVQSYNFILNAAKTIGFVGTNSKYAKALEFGTKYMRPRPHLLISFKAAIKKSKNKGFRKMKLKG